MKTIAEILTLSASFLQERKMERGRRTAEELLAHLLQLKRIDLYLQYDRPLEDKELVQMREWLQRAGKGEPVEYITGEVSFCGCRIQVNRQVLIPRPETELLVELVAKSNPKGSLWDVCCGSGAIGISLKKKFPELQVSLSDTSEGALNVARQNGKLNETEATFLQGDFLEPFQGEKCDLMVCNPPYVSAEEYQTLDPSVRDFEPKLALVGGEDGLFFYKKLAIEALDFLSPGGRLFLEIGYAQGAAVSKIFIREGWKNQQLFKDWAGHDRFFSLEKQ